MNYYSKLSEAFRIFLNPTLELIQKYDDISPYCYYHLHKLPPANHSMWEMLESNQLDQIIAFTKDIEAHKKLPKKLNHEHLIHNLILAYEKNDLDYFNFLSQQRPQTKLKVNLMRKKSLVDPQIAAKFGLDEISSKKVTPIGLKILIHQYIRQNNLQTDNNVILNQLLVEILSIEKNHAPSIHYFELLNVFNKKFMPHVLDNIKDNDLEVVIEN